MCDIDYLPKDLQNMVDEYQKQVKRARLQQEHSNSFLPTLDYILNREQLIKEEKQRFIDDVMKWDDEFDRELDYDEWLNEFLPIEEKHHMILKKIKRGIEIEC